MWWESHGGLGPGCRGQYLTFLYAFEFERGQNLDFNHLVIISKLSILE